MLGLLACWLKLIINPGIFLTMYFLAIMRRINNNYGIIMIIEAIYHDKPKSVFVFIICVLPIPTVSHLM
jgi:hypothetical protein